MIKIANRRRTDGVPGARAAHHLIPTALVLVVACADQPPASRDGARSDTTAVSPASPMPETSMSAERVRELRAAAEAVVSFLSGDSDFDQLNLADTVTLYLSPEGGGGSVRRSRSQLSSIDAWAVPSGGGSYSFVPSGVFTRMTARVGRHFNCFEYPLASRSPALAREAHVGVMLDHEGANCLQTWNATFVFDTTVAPPRLMAALYDQWEW